MREAATDLFVRRGGLPGSGLRSLWAPAVELLVEEVAVPRLDVPAPGERVAEIDDVFLLADVRAVHRFRHRAPRVVERHVHIRAEPSLVLISADAARGAFVVAGRGAEEAVQIAEIIRLARALAEHVVSAALHAEDVSIGQSVLVFEMVVLIFKREVEAEEVTVELRRGRFCCGINHAPLQIARVRRGNAGELREAELHDFIEPGEPATPRSPRRGNAADIQRLDSRLFRAVVVRHGKELAGIELELPLVLPGVERRALAFDAVAHVVVNDAIDDDRAVEAIHAVVERSVVLARLHISGLREQMPRPHLAHRRLGKSRGARDSRLHRRSPRRHAVVAEIREVRARLRIERKCRALPELVGRRDAVADEPTVLLHAAGDDG